MYCVKCGKQLEDGKTFCKDCKCENAGIALREPQRDEILTVGDYIGIMLLMIIPAINIIMLLSWAFSRNVNPNRRNYARAMLIVSLIGILALILLGVTSVMWLSEFMKSLA